MKVILHVVAVLAAGGAAYFSLDLSEKLRGEQDLRVEAIRENQQLTASAEREEADREERRTDRDAKLTDRATLNATLDSLRSEAASMQRQLASLDATLEQQSEEFANLEEALEEANRLLVDLGQDVTLDTIGQTVQDIERRKVEREARLEELEELVRGAELNLERNRDDSARLAGRRVERSARISRNASEAVLTAVNQEWGFVVIGAGSNTGFTPETTLLIQRDGRMVGRVTPTSIEPNQTIADIQLDSLSPGVRLQPGDRVILARPLAN